MSSTATTRAITLQLRRRGAKTGFSRLSTALARRDPLHTVLRRGDLRSWKVSVPRRRPRRGHGGSWRKISAAADAHVDPDGSQVQRGERPPSLRRGNGTRVGILHRRRTHRGRAETESSNQCDCDTGRGLDQAARHRAGVGTTRLGRRRGSDS